MKNILMFLRKRGFTLVEALVVTIIAGYCILPVVGTLQSGMNSTESFDHREKLRVLARSRLNKEIAFGAFDHTAINTSPTYHYVYYNADAEPKLMTIDTDVASNSFFDLQEVASVSSILYSYKVSVEVKENLKLATSAVNINSKFTTGLSGLKAITVLAELEPNENVISTDSFSLFSLLNIPSFSEDYIWISNPKNVEIIAVDPISRTKVESFLLPLDDATKSREDSANDTARPWNIAVHPNKKFVIVQCKYKIKALNIDKNSPYFGNVKEIWPSDEINTDSYASKLADVVKDDKTKASEDNGIVFRPDGKFCYVSAHEEKKVFSFVASNTANWPTLKLLNKTEYFTNKDKHSVLHAGNDGWLYVGPKDGKMALRFPMYSENIFAGTPQTITDSSNQNILSLDTTPDGREFYILWATNIITRHSSATGQKIGQTVLTPTPSGLINDIKLSRDGKYMGVVDAGSGVGKGGFFLLNLRTYPVNGTNFTVTDTTVFKKADPNNLGKKEKIEYCMFVPQSGEFVFDEEKKPYLFCVDIPGLNAATFTSGIPDDRVVNYAPVDKSLVAMTVRTPDYLLLGCNDGIRGYVDYIDIYETVDNDPKKRKIDEQLRIDLPTNATTPYNIALNAGGDKFKVAYGPFRSGLDTYDTFGSRTRLNGSNHGDQWMYDVVLPNEGFHPNALPDQAYFVSMDYHPTTGWANGYWADLPEPDSPTGISPVLPIPPGYKDPSNIGISLGWAGQDIELLQNGGVLILYRNTSNDHSLLEWIGKHRWGGINGRYERFARWHSLVDGFPPVNAYEMEISPDGRQIAFMTGDTPNRIVIYDFAANNFGNQTQMNGLITDYRIGKTTVDTAVYANARIPAGRKLYETFTASETWPSLRTEPTNFYSESAAFFASDITFRAFGYLLPTNTIQKFSIVHRDGCRLYINNSPPAKLCDEWGSFLGPDSIGPETKVVPANTSVFMQVERSQENNPNGVAVMYTTNSTKSTFSAPTTPTVDGSYGLSSDADWVHIANSETRPFRFTPTYVRSYSISGTSADGGTMCYSRDTADPVLYTLVHNDDRLIVSKVGRPPTTIDLVDFDWLSNQMVVSPDGQRLIYGSRDTGTIKGRLKIVDISNPASFSFNGGTYLQTSLGSYGALIGDFEVPRAPVCLAVKPLGYHKSTPREGRFESVATLSVNISGLHNAALASGGIYILGSSPLENGTPDNKIFRFDPGTNYTAAITPLTATLTKGIKMNSIAVYDNEIYLFNGRDTAAASDWVQKYNPTTGITRSSFDPPTAVTTEFQVNHKMTASDKANGAPTPTRATYSGSILSDYYGWKIFDSSSAFGDGWGPTTASQSVIYTTGSSNIKIIVNKLQIDNTYSPSSYQVKTFNLQGSNDGSSWVTLHSQTNLTQDSSVPINVSNSTAYSWYRFNFVANYGGTDFGVREVEFWTKGVRRISPLGACTVDATAKTAVFGSKTVSWSAHGSTDYGSKVFDGNVDDTNKWDTNTTSGFPHWVAVDLLTPDNVDILRIHCKNADDGIKNFEFQYSDDGSTWNSLQINGATTVENPDNTAWNTYHVTNVDKHRHYRIKCYDSWTSEIEAWEIEFFSTMSAPAISGEPFMTKVMTDDRSTIKAQEGAACTTPYGIMVAGGKDAGGTATSTAMIYWPHAIDAFTDASNYAMGISRSISPLPAARHGHCLVYHKGKVYRIGGKDGANAFISAVDIFDFETNTWGNPPLTATGYFDANGALVNRYKAAACSFGDEILIFGGIDSFNTARNDIVAWNTETKEVRILTTMPKTTNYAISAVPCGSSIYLIGGSTNGTTGATASIWKFTP